MAPYLQTVQSFTDVPITESGVDTLTFLKASEGLCGIFDLLGSGAFSVVQNDLKGNINKIRARYDAQPSKSTTLEQLVEHEKDEKKRTATEGMLWLLRGMSFTCKGLQNSQSDKTQELSQSFSKAYEGTLKPHHNFVVKGLFSVAMKACPYRSDFYKKLAGDAADGPSITSTEKVSEDLDKWLHSLDTIVKHMDDFYTKGGHSKGF